MMGWFTGFYVVQSSSEYCPGRVLKKKLQKFLRDGKENGVDVSDVLYF